MESWANLIDFISLSFPEPHFQINEHIYGPQVLMEPFANCILGRPHSQVMIVFIPQLYNFIGESYIKNAGFLGYKLGTCVFSFHIPLLHVSNTQKN